MEKPKSSPFDIAIDMIRATGNLMAGKTPKAESLATPGMKKVAKAIGDVAIFGWSNRKG
jgi:hypothetical protein